MHTSLKRTMHCVDIPGINLVSSAYYGIVIPLRLIEFLAMMSSISTYK